MPHVYPRHNPFRMNPRANPAKRPSATVARAAKRLVAKIPEHTKGAARKKAFADWAKLVAADEAMPENVRALARDKKRIDDLCNVIYALSYGDWHVGSRNNPDDDDETPPPEARHFVGGWYVGPSSPTPSRMDRLHKSMAALKEEFGEVAHYMCLKQDENGLMDCIAYGHSHENMCDVCEIVNNALIAMNEVADMRDY